MGVQEANPLVRNLAIVKGSLVIGERCRWRAQTCGVQKTTPLTRNPFMSKGILGTRTGAGVGSTCGVQRAPPLIRNPSRVQETRATVEATQGRFGWGGCGVLGWRRRRQHRRQRRFMEAWMRGYGKEWLSRFG